MFFFSYLLLFKSVLYESNDGRSNADCIGDDNWEFIVVFHYVVADVQ